MKLKLFLFLISCISTASVFAQQGFPFDHKIRAFKHQDSISFPKPNGILFIGSSSIRLWEDLEHRFADKPSGFNIGVHYINSQEKSLCIYG